MATLCKAPTKSAGIGLSITAVCKNVGKKNAGTGRFFCSEYNFVLYKYIDEMFGAVVCL